MLLIGLDWWPSQPSNSICQNKPISLLFTWAQVQTDTWYQCFCGFICRFHSEIFSTKPKEFIGHQTVGPSRFTGASWCTDIRRPRYISVHWHKCIAIHWPEQQCKSKKKTTQIYNSIQFNSISIQKCLLSHKSCTYKKHKERHSVWTFNQYISSLEAVRNMMLYINITVVQSNNTVL